MLSENEGIHSPLNDIPLNVKCRQQVWEGEVLRNQPAPERQRQNSSHPESSEEKLRVAVLHERPPRGYRVQLYEIVFA